MIRLLIASSGFVFLLLLSACGPEAKTADETTSTEAMDDQPNAFDEVAEAMEAGSSPAQLRKLLLTNYGKVANAQTGQIDPRASKQYVMLAEQFATKVGSDTLAALPLYKAAEVYQALNNYEKAAVIFERVHRDYPSFSKAGEALFMLGFTYDENLENFQKAKDVYEQFLKEYPDNTFADDTQLLLKNLGKTDAEMLESLGQ